MNLLRTLRRLLPMPVIETYNDHRIAERVFAKTAMARKPPTQYIPYHYKVLDFGGGAGVAYYQSTPVQKWAIVETPAMVQHALRSHPPEDLGWFTTINDAVEWLGGPPHLILCDGALQYTFHPYTQAISLASLGAQRIIYRRLPTHAANSILLPCRSYLSDHGPGPAFGKEAYVVVPYWTLNAASFRNAHWQYDCAQSGDTWEFTLRSTRDLKSPPL